MHHLISIISARCVNKRRLFYILLGLVLTVVVLYNRGNSPKPKRVSIYPFFVKPHFNENQWDQLPDLRKISWPKSPCASIPTGSRFGPYHVVRLPKPLDPVMSCGQRNVSKQLLKIFTNLMFANGFGDRFMLNGGTLVGSYQHHDLVPWDDDMDVLVDMTVRPQVLQLLRTLEPEFIINTNSQHDKFYTKIMNSSQLDLDLPLSRITSNFTWAWPYLDIGYFESNSTHFWDVSNIKKPDKILIKSLVFPLLFRPLGTDWYPTPFNALGYMTQIYGSKRGCAVFGYSHVLEGRQPRGRAYCWSLTRRYAFVKHLLARPNQYVLSEPQWRRQVTVGLEMLFYSTLYGPKILHTLPIPTVLDATSTNTQLFSYIYI
ncbi:unnamed protein product [Echinostoma caproni]|uniref:Lipopolysaccharide choline phosphotransferase n=1 Tax=Echinostoma caproni TaxID=27848 RepID=A0A183ACG9_9TREM|nr:unnamed protein product [Echinostoma caproni]